MILAATFLDALTPCQSPDDIRALAADPKWDNWQGPRTRWRLIAEHAPAVMFDDAALMEALRTDGGADGLWVLAKRDGLSAAAREAVIRETMRLLDSLGRGDPDMARDAFNMAVERDPITPDSDLFQTLRSSARRPVPDEDSFRARDVAARYYLTFPGVPESDLQQFARKAFSLGGAVVRHPKSTLPMWRAVMRRPEFSEHSVLALLEHPVAGSHPEVMETLRTNTDWHTAIAIGIGTRDYFEKAQGAERMRRAALFVELAPPDMVEMTMEDLPPFDDATLARLTSGPRAETAVVAYRIATWQARRAKATTPRKPARVQR